MISLLALALAATQPSSCSLELIVLGAGQDAGAPQIGNNDDPAWTDPDRRLLATSLALVDHASGRRYLFEATPDIGEQLHMLDQLAPAEKDRRLGIDGIFLTHAHIGHYAGLMMLGFESANTEGVPVYVMPRMATFLAANGPWKQLIDFGNIAVATLNTDRAAIIGGDLAVYPMVVPHRDEFSETVGYSVSTLGKRFFFLPDIDSFAVWEAEGGPSLEAIVNGHDLVFIDSTFFDDGELDRDMSAIPHPRTKQVMQMLDHFPPEMRAKVQFIHYNHSNPIRDPGSAQSKMVAQAGFNVARRSDRHCLAI